MAHRAPDTGCLKVGAGVAVGGVLLVVLCGAGLARCDEGVGPAHRPADRRPAPSVERAPSWQPARPGDMCEPRGATSRSNTGATLTCDRRRGLSYDTWG